MLKVGVTSQAPIVVVRRDTGWRLGSSETEKLYLTSLWWFLWLDLYVNIHGFCVEDDDGLPGVNSHDHGMMLQGASARSRSVFGRREERKKG